MSMYSFEVNGTLFSFELNSKINILLGLSGTGKTAFCNSILVANEITPTGIHVIRDYGVDTALLEDCDLLVIDEPIMNKYISKGKLDLLTGSFKQILIITRDALRSLSYSYKDIFEIVKGDRTFTLRRKYPDFNKLDFSVDYTEDKKAGYRYFQQFYPDVQSADGKDNLRKLPVDSGIVADGCAIGSSIRLLYSNFKLFLPESFEWLLLRKHCDVSDVSSVLDVEGYYTEKAKRILPFGYDKTRFNKAYASRKYIADFEVSDDYLITSMSKFGRSYDLIKLREVMYSVTGDYTTEQVVCIALITLYLSERFI